MGRDFRASRGAAGLWQVQPAVAHSSGHNAYLVVWRDDRNEEDRFEDIYGQRVTNTGVRDGASFRISHAAATRFEDCPAVAHNGASSGFLVVRTDGRNETTRGKDIYGRRVTE